MHLKWAIGSGCFKWSHRSNSSWVEQDQERLHEPDSEWPTQRQGVKMWDF